MGPTKKAVTRPPILGGMGSRPVVFWDFDGTLAERDGMWPAVLHDAIRSTDPDRTISIADLAPWLVEGFPRWKPGQLRVFPDAAAWWASAGTTLVDACCAAGLDPSTAERAVAAVPRIYDRPGNWRIKAGAFEALTAARDAGLTNAILSNHAPELPQLVDALGFEPLVDARSPVPRSGSRNRTRACTGLRCG